MYRYIDISISLCIYKIEAGSEQKKNGQWHFQSVVEIGRDSSSRESSGNTPA